MARWAYLLGGLASVGIAAGGVAIVETACLPGLIAPDAGVDSGSCNGVPCCGDGLIEPDAGETCDPGNMNINGPFCEGCRIQCTAPDGGVAKRDETVSNHCYVSLPGHATEAVAVTTCGRLNAHVVTLVDEDEVSFVQQNVTTSRYWIGLDDLDVGDAGEAEYDSVRLLQGEPGWAGTSYCSGCYSPGAIPDAQALQTIDGGVEAGSPGCVAANNGTTAVAIGCNARAKVVCEHEPIGSRAQTCPEVAVLSRLDGYCFDLVKTAAPDKKHYFYSATPATPAVAASDCTSFGGHGAPSGSLVIFESGAEREQLIWELFQSRRVMEGSKFWIGLSAVRGDGGINWVWHDFQPYPSVWGFGMPPADAPPNAQAFLFISSSFDTGLAQVPAGGADNKLPFVCQWSD